MSIDAENKSERYLKILHKKESSLTETKARDNKESWKEKILIPIFTAVISAVISGVVVALIVGRICKKTYTIVHAFLSYSSIY